MDLFKHHISRSSLILVLTSTVLTACMVGPNFKQPESPKTNRYTEKSISSKTVTAPKQTNAGKSQSFAFGKDIPTDWWTLFHSEELNTLIQRGLKNNPTLDAAKAALRNSEEILKAQIGNLLVPSFNANVLAQRQRVNLQSVGIEIQGPLSKSIFNLYNVGVSVSYALDIFGGARRQIEAYSSQVDYQQYELLATYLTLTSNIATTAIAVASLHDQVEVTKELIREQEQQLTIIQQQFKVGGVSLENVANQENLVAQTKANLPVLEKTLAQYRNALAILVGATPSEGDLPTLSLSMFELPKELPVSLPSSLAKQRPDILASEAILHAASAQVGVATANLFPQLTLSGAYGWSATELNQLFSSSVKVWDYALGIAQPIFRGGALLAQRRAAIAAFEQAFAQYKFTVLQAFQNVADSLQAIENDARTFRAQKQAELATRKNMLLIQQQLKLGGVSYLNLLAAQQQYQQAVLIRIQAQAARYSDTAALFQALGGGWWQNKTASQKDQAHKTCANQKPVQC